MFVFVFFSLNIPFIYKYNKKIKLISASKANKQNNSNDPSKKNFLKKNSLINNIEEKYFNLRKKW